MEYQETEVQEMELTEEDYSAVIYWVDERKVGIAPIVLVPPSDRTVGTITRIRPPGFQKEYVGRIEGISGECLYFPFIYFSVSSCFHATCE